MHAKNLHSLVHQFSQPLRLGIFGHRGVGKTTLLTALYREAASGRFPQIRLAAADPRTADYLGDKIGQLELGLPLPATLAETELRLHLYHDDARIDLLVRDYQGEHVELGRAEPIRKFLAGCDAVWFCLEAPSMADPTQRLRRQQEAEQLIEDCLSDEPGLEWRRPAALVLTKADLLETNDSDGRVNRAEAFAVVLHALRTHNPRHTVIPVSSLTPTDTGLGELLAWQAREFRALDAARLDRLFAERLHDPTTLAHALDAYARRYPGARTLEYHRRLRETKQRRRRRFAGLAAAAIASALGLTAVYDAVGHRQAAAFEQAHEDHPGLARKNWEEFRAWHPTRHVFSPKSAEEETKRLAELERKERSQRQASLLAELRRLADDTDADPEASWEKLKAFRAEFPDASSADLELTRSRLDARRQALRAQLAQAALDELDGKERGGADLPELVAAADALLREHHDSPVADETRRRREAWLHRIDVRDFQAARDYDAAKPLHFQTRIENYRRYLDRHAHDGAFAREANAAIEAIASAWDRYDYEAVRTHHLTRPGDVTSLQARARNYLVVHPRGKYVAVVGDLLRWSERVARPGEYRVVLKNGSFDKKIARFFSRGPDLSVELEVAGLIYGPSPITVNTYEPEWEYEFPRPIRWKLGDPVVIRVREHDWKQRTVVTIESAEDDPLAMKLLSGDAWSGNYRLTFCSDFTLPRLP
jgi:GTPase SAR1 family protein